MDRLHGALPVHGLLGEQQHLQARGGEYVPDIRNTVLTLCFFSCMRRDAPDQKLPCMFSKVSITTTQSGCTCCRISFMMFSGTATQPPV